MKLKKLSYLKYKLTKLELIKFKLYQNALQKFDITETYFKKAITIIHQFHIKNKKILFMGADKTVQNKYKNISKHLFLPESYWIKGLLTNKIIIFKYIKKNQQKFIAVEKKRYLFLKNKPNLVVLLNDQNQTSIMKEATKLKIPVIALNIKKVNLDEILYPIYINNLPITRISNNLTINLLNSILKKKK